MKNYLYTLLAFLLTTINVLAYDNIEPGTFKKLLDDKHLKHFTSDLDIKFRNEIAYDLHSNKNYHAKKKTDNAESVGRLYSNLNFAQNLSLNSTLHFERLQQQTQNDDNILDREGLYLRELNLTYDNKKHGFIVGKFDLNFGKAWNFNRGIVSHKMAQNYVQSEKIGFGEVLRIGDLEKTGRYQFAYSFFKNDRKYLDNSIITSRHSPSKIDASAGDDNLFGSYILSMDVDFDFDKETKLNYHFSYLNAAINEKFSNVLDQNKIDDQKSYVVAMNYITPLSQDVVMDSLIEYVDIKNYQGNADIGEKYLSVNSILKFYQNYNLTLGHATRQNIQANSSGFDETITEISAGYDIVESKLFDKLTIQLGYEYLRNDFKTSLESKNSLIALLRYQKRF